MCLIIIIKLKLFENVLKNSKIGHVDWNCLSCAVQFWYKSGLFFNFSFNEQRVKVSNKHPIRTHSEYISNQI